VSQHEVECFVENLFMTYLASLQLSKVVKVEVK